MVPPRRHAGSIWWMFAIRNTTFRTACFPRRCAHWVPWSGSEGSDGGGDGDRAPGRRRKLTPRRHASVDGGCGAGHGALVDYAPFFDHPVVGIKVKICGITCPEDAAAVVHAHADALGLNFSSASPRYVEPAQAAEISAETAGKLCRAGLFVNAQPAVVEAVLQRVALDVLQFSGDETPSYCAGFGLPYMKAIRMREGVDFVALEDAYADACCLLLDAYAPGVYGGTGTSFDLSLWPTAARKPLVLAGGLTPGNVAAAVRRVQPFGVDVSSGVEAEHKGRKDPQRIVRFVEEVTSVGG